jgi:hypothetical protein
MRGSDNPKGVTHTSPAQRGYALSAQWQRRNPSRVEELSRLTDPRVGPRYARTNPELTSETPLGFRLAAKR